MELVFKFREALRGACRAHTQGHALGRQTFF